MSELELNSDLPIQGEIVEFSGSPTESPSSSLEQEDLMGNILLPVLRRWYVVLLTFLTVCVIGGVLIYYLMGKKFDTEGAIRVSMVVPRILYEIEDQSAPYNPFKKTQAASIGFDSVLNRAADELKDKKIIFLNPNESSLVTLRRMIVDGQVKIDAPRDNELIYIRMTTDYPRHAEQLIDAIIRGYMSVVVSEETQGDDEKLSVLEQRRRIMEDKLEVQKLKVRARAEEFGTSELTPYQEMMQQQMATLQDELIEIAIQRIMLETKVSMKEKNLDRELTSEDIVDQQTDFIESDSLVQALHLNIRKYNELIREGQVIMKESNPELKRRVETLRSFQDQLEARKSEIVNKFQKQIKKEVQRSHQKELELLKEELSQTVTYESRIREKLEEIDKNTIGLGHKQFDINDAQEELDQMKRIYNDLCRRIEQVNLERSRDPRISIASFARSVEAKGKRRKMATATALGGMALGVVLALLLDKRDKRLKNPKELIKRIGVRIIGTTTDPHGIDKKLLPQQIIDDYQTIHTNISLLDEYKDTKMIVVTSPGNGDGKTTFSINLAVTFARSGKRTLLIDGDLRKPDVGHDMRLPSGLRGLQDYLFGEDIDKTAYKVPSLNLFVLSADGRNANDALELITVPASTEKIQNLRNQFDCIIIDTPPVLAFSDSLVWAKMADGVILMSFLGHTSKVEMQEARERLEQVKVRILGTVVNNVKVSQGYQRYGYGYAEGRDALEKRRSHKKNAPYSLLVQDDDMQD